MMYIQGQKLLILPKTPDFTKKDFLLTIHDAKNFASLTMSSKNEKHFHN